MQFFPNYRITMTAHIAHSVSKLLLELYFCTNNASKLRTCVRDAKALLQALLQAVGASKASKLSVPPLLSLGPYLTLQAFHVTLLLLY